MTKKELYTRIGKITRTPVTCFEDVMRFCRMPNDDGLPYGYISPLPTEAEALAQAKAIVHDVYLGRDTRILDIGEDFYGYNE